MKIKHGKVPSMTFSIGLLAVLLFFTVASITAAVAPEPVDAVDPFLGAVTSHPSSPNHGLGKTAPGPCTPYGLVQLGPDTITGGDNGSGYSYSHSTIEGFSFTHLSGVGWYGEFGNLQVMPQIGKPVLDREAAKATFAKSSEKASAGYYAVQLDRGGIGVELTAAPRAGIIRCTFPAAETARIKVDLARRVGGRSVKQYIHRLDDCTAEGWMDCDAKGGGWGHGAGRCSYMVYFRMAFSVPMRGFGIWETTPPPDALREEKRRKDWVKQGNNLKTLPPEPKPTTTVWRDRNEATTEAGGFFIEFPTTNSQQVLFKAGISFASLEGAEKNLQQDIPEWDFDTVHRQARESWAKVLDVIHVEGGTLDQQQIFYTSLYRTLIDPRCISDADGSFRAIDGTIQKAKGYTQRTVFSGWDVFRSQFPLMTLIAPQVVGDTINSLLYVARTDNQGCLPRWEIMLRESGCMLGDPAVPVIVDAWRKGIRGYDAAEVWKAIRKTCLGPDAKRSHFKYWAENGWEPGDVSRTLEYAYDDACAAWFAHEMKVTNDAAVLWQRAHNYTNIFDSSVHWMHARNADGSWTEWKGRTVQGQGCTESNPFQQGWFVPQDVPGLIALLGKDRFIADLNEFLDKSHPEFLWNDYYNQANEPVHQVPFMAVYAGQPWLVQKWTSAVLDRGYKTGPYGLVGNEDVGQMSAWYVLAALGLHPVCSGDPIYIITRPLFPKATLRLDPTYAKGRTFTISANSKAPGAIYIQSAKLNGNTLDRAWLTHSEITAGGKLELELVSEPDHTWGTTNLPPTLIPAKPYE
ncbi:MAG: GH92 family glycosyl hydrolase [Verrucomicrobiota bacterium]